MKIKILLLLLLLMQVCFGQIEKQINTNSNNILFTSNAPIHDGNGWLSVPSQGSFVNIKNLTVSGNHPTVEAVENRTLFTSAPDPANLYQNNGNTQIGARSSNLASIIINDYTPVFGFDGCKNTLVVEDGSKYNADDIVLLIQMKGTVVDSTNTTAFGNIIDYKSAGNYEFNYVKSRTGNSIELKNSLSRTYEFTTGKVQLVRVPTFTDYVVTDMLTCLPWDGTKGGVLALNVTGTLTLNNEINVSGKGFSSPGPSTNSIHPCNADDYFYSTPANGGEKGAGITNINPDKKYGKGKLANAGGGGNSDNSGGGGGSNIAKGGNGGNQWQGCSPDIATGGGIGGSALLNNSTLNKAFMGGSGGLGHTNDQIGYFGAGNGGGIIFITATNLNGNSFGIKANGTNATECLLGAGCTDATSGGGGAGEIFINIPNVLTNCLVEAKGGKGADNSYNDPVNYPNKELGTGGGGGGGLIAIQQPTSSGLFTLDATGGPNGVNTAHGNDPHGATAGDNGLVANSFPAFWDNTPFKPNIDSARFNFIYLSCSNINFNGLAYTNTVGITDWQWSFGDGSTANTQNTAHNYAAAGNYSVKLVVTDINGCKDSILKTISVGATDFDFNYEFNTCNPLAVQFHATGATASNPWWSFGDASTSSGNTNPLHTYAAQGNYVVKYTAGNGACSDTLTKSIDFTVAQGNIVLTQDTTICYGTQKQLKAVPALNFCWSPTTYLDNPNSATPITSATTNIVYYYTAQIQGNNLIVNGDFSQGNTGFTSEYNYVTPNITEGQYYVGPSPTAWNPSMSACSGHTTGNDNMLLMNGSPAAGLNVWKETISVTPNTNYVFSTWVQALSLVNPAQLQFSFNGKATGSLITASLPTCTWTQFYTTWNSGNNTSVVISIVNQNTFIQGNDFALDDISFAPITIQRDSVVIKIDTPFIKTNNDTTICAGNKVQLNTSGLIASFNWSPSTGLSNPQIANPVATPPASTQYIVTGIDAVGCAAKDTVNITTKPLPTIIKIPDSTICHDKTIQLNVSGGNTYTWAASPTLSSTSVSNPVASPVSNTTYYVTVTDNNLCSSNDSIKIAIAPKPVFTVSEDQTVCKGSPVQLLASGGDSYIWTPIDGLNSAAIANPSATPEASAVYSVKINASACNDAVTLSTSITVNPLPVVAASKSNDIDCTKPVSQLNATGATTYLWQPANTVSDTAIASPQASPEVTTTYIVKGIDSNGCSNYDSIKVLVTKAGDLVVNMPNAFSPNGDGNNDCFGINRYIGLLKNVDFSVYDRWGVRVFHTNNTQNCWDGRYKGKVQNVGGFVYILKASTFCGEIFKKGIVMLIK